MYIATMSIDGFVADERGSFDWTAPDEERHQFINDLVRRAGTLLMGRRMYDTMVVWEDPAIDDGASAAVTDFRTIWLAAQKVVFSRSLQAVRSEKTRVMPELDPRAIREMKSAAAADMSIGGPEVANQALSAGLVDEVHLFAVPFLIGSGNRGFTARINTRLQLLAERRFDDGTLYTAYSLASVGAA